MERKRETQSIRNEKEKHELQNREGRKRDTALKEKTNGVRVGRNEEKRWKR